MLSGEMVKLNMFSKESLIMKTKRQLGIQRVYLHLYIVGNTPFNCKVAK